MRRLAHAVRLAESDEMNAAFPDRRCARVTLALTDGTRLSSRVSEAPGDPEDPLTAADLDDKFRRSTASSLGVGRGEPR